MSWLVLDCCLINLIFFSLRHHTLSLSPHILSIHSLQFSLSTQSKLTRSPHISSQLNSRAESQATSSSHNNMSTPVISNSNSQFGDTTYTKVFVGGLAWETQKDTMKQYFDQFGDILEAVVISDKSTGRSKGYGFVTFCEAESAMKACVDASPVIDGRRANCNLAAFATQKSKPSSPAINKIKLQGGVIEGISMNNNNIAIQKGGVVRVAGMGATAFACATNFPHYAIQQAAGSMPYNNVVGYSQDYTYPTNYYGIHYPIYGTTAGTNNVGMMTSATPYYPYVQYPTIRSGSYGHYASHPHHQQQHHHHMVHYSAMNNYSTGGGSSYNVYQPYASYCPPITMTPSPIMPFRQG